MQYFLLNTLLFIFVLFLFSIRKWYSKYYIPGPPWYYLCYDCINGNKLLKYHEKYGPVIRIPLVGPLFNIISIAEPTIVKPILENSSTYITVPRIVRNVVKSILPDCMMAVDDANWHRQKKVIIKLLNQHKKYIFKTSFMVYQKMIINIDTEQPIDIRLFFYNAYLEIVLSTFFGLRLYNDNGSIITTKDGQIDSNMIKECIQFLSDMLSTRVYRVVPYHLWLAGLAENKRVMHSKQILNNLFEMVLFHESNKVNDEYQIFEYETDSSKQFLSLLRQELNKGILNKAELLDNMVVFLLGGLDSFPSFLTFAVKYLTENSFIQKNLVQEIQKYLSENTISGSRFEKYEQIFDIPYVFNVLRETMRLAPTISLAGRETKEELEIYYFHKKSNERVSYIIPYGSRILLNFYAMSHNEEYFANAEKYDPTRFEHPTEFVQYTMRPFGGGKHTCIAKVFAEKVLIIGLGLLFSQYCFLADNSKQSYVKDSIISTPESFFVFANKHCFFSKFT